MGLDMYLTAGDTEVGYWRKANAIHGWIVKNKANDVDECQDIPLTRGDLEELQALCQTVLEDHEKAELLPPTAGFFFGSSEIDEGYFSDLQDTVGICTKALATKNDFFIYRASW